MISMFFMLLFGHALGDYPLQGEYLALSKDPNNPLGKNGIWVHSLMAHAMIHAGFVALFTHMVFLGILEFVAHFIIDYLKVEKKIGYHLDQFLHVLCKIIWVIIAFSLHPR